MSTAPGHGGRRSRRWVVVGGLLLAAIFGVWFWLTFHTRWDENRRLPLEQSLQPDAIPAANPAATQP